MARYTGSVCKICRREGFKLYLKGERCFSPKCAQVKRPFAPGQHGAATRKLTQYGMQLRSKQALKRMYGLLEKQFRRYFDIASRKAEETGSALIKLLESRLDNAVFRMGFASSRRQARQLVNHGHVLVNGRKVNKASYLLKPGDIVELKEKSKDIVPVKEAMEAAQDRTTPPWLEIDFEAARGTFVRFPNREEVEIPVDLQSIIELYSK
ncbi:30S ribosomal protein S4 [Kosmotoga arenicorallina S304]|uniref:Small ribosomal subunit protein uS4 n=1 Tax=Kosmotoga arenicorallina S304 TaxID=1453497 RepID=A0A176K1R7_9BACT|nr:30S ribosomal protein S4 [Kosmotoga arenicorallina]OAA30839.1 30S ribosomal protein S4 [Kosmotoga arenicorallina S304]